MTRNALFLIALCALLTLCAAPAGADGDATAAPPPAADGCAPDMSTPLDLQPPDVTYAGPCNVSRQCDDGSTISCSGSTTCTSGPGDGGGYVECDGNRTWCPVETCSDGEFCKFDSMCGTCYGYQCVCINLTCICP